jgi:hypothetical protein
VDDLSGVVLAGGDWVRADNSATARLSVVVDASWRVAAVSEAFAELGLGPSDGPAENGTGVRTEFSARLAPQAARWTRGAVLRPPPDLDLTARALRLWALAAGRAESSGYLLGTASPDDELHRIAGAQLARLGLAATAITIRAAPGWRVTSTKRLRRLAELLGDKPPGSGSDWPDI